MVTIFAIIPLAKILATFFLEIGITTVMKHKMLLLLTLLLVAFKATASSSIPDENELRSSYEKAERALLANNLEQAKMAYEELIDAVDVKVGGQFGKFTLDWRTYVDLHCRLATIYQRLGQYKNGETLLHDLLQEEPPPHLLVAICPRYAKFLLASQKGDFAFQTLSTLKEQTPIEQWHKEDSSLYRALAYVQKGKLETLIVQGASFFAKTQYPQAISYFELALEGIKNQTLPTPKTAFLDELYFHLAEGHFYLNNYAKALKYLHKGQKTGRADYLAAVIHLRQDQTSLAIFRLQDALKHPSTKREANLQLEELYAEALSALEKGDPSSLEKAESILLGLKSEEGKLTLARLYLQQLEQGIGTDVEKKLTLLLKGSLDSLTLEGQGESLFLLARAMDTYEEKERLYKFATANTFAHTPYYPLNWASRGLNHLTYALQISKNRELYLDKAIHAFQCALPSLEKENHRTLMKALAHALFYRNTKGTRRSCLALIETLPEESLTEDMLYLEAILTAKRVIEERKEEYFPFAEQKLQALTQGAYAPDALFALGVLYNKSGCDERAAHTFIEVADRFPTSHLAPKALYFAAETKERLGESARLLRTRLFSAYPTSPLADESYFLTYSMDEYTHGDKRALAHLKQFETHFPSSPYKIPANTFLALAYVNKDPLAAIATLNETLSIFDATNPTHIPFTLFYYRSMLELGRLYNAEKQFILAAASFANMVADFETPSHPLTAPLLHANPFPRLYQEALLGLTKCYIGQKEYKQGQTFLSRALIAFAENGIEKSDLLAHFWLEEGKIALETEQVTWAAKCFEKALYAGENTLLGDEKLSIWMLQSQTHQKLGELSEAMSKLSLVINEDIASPLRIKAMMQRAEIYSLQGREQLAMRQLQAVEKKGGQIGKMAKEKLRDVYGMD